MRAPTLLLALGLTLLAALGAFRTSYESFQSQELVRAQGRLSLYQTSVEAALDQFSPLAHVLARDTPVIETSIGGNTSALNQRLADFAAQAGLEAIYLMDTTGRTIAASNHDLPTSFLGQNYGFRPYFRDAMAGQTGRFYAIGTTTGRPGYFVTNPVRDASGTIIGVIAIKIGFAALETSWAKAGEQVFLANEDGVILLASNPDWRYRVLTPLSTAQRQQIQAARQFADQPLAPLDWRETAPQAATIAGQDRIHLTATTAPHGWTLHYFASDDRAVARAWLVTAAVVVLAGLALIVWQVLRTRQVGEALARSEEQEATLRLANARLAVEIEDRKTAERRLKRTQNELERSSRLAALGQLAASVTHELGQPIAAMRNHLVAAEIGGGTAPPVVNRISGLVDRMEGITRQLKFFATPDADPFEPVDLCAALRASAALVEPNLAAARAAFRLDLPAQPVLVRGSRLRIEQVMTNILRNAIDATEDQDAPRIAASVGQTSGEAWFEVADNGHGLGDATLAELQEPFVTSRESGRGMGLGLAISASIVEDHQGTMSAHPSPGGGTVFRVVFPAPIDEDAAP